MIKIQKEINKQCDQMATLFLKYLAFYNKFAKVGSTFSKY